MTEPVEPIARLATALAARADPGARLLVGIAGAPGAGKTTAADALRAALIDVAVPTAVVPMDGFHLADVTLRRLGRLDRKGAPDTFDGDGFVALLRRLRAETARTVYAAGFERGLEQPIAASVAVDPEVQVVVTEGNYLLLDADPWNQVPDLLDEVVYVDLDPAERRRRLRARHEQFGKSPDAARRWVDEVDEPNAVLVEASAARASRRVSLPASYSGDAR